VPQRLIGGFELPPGPIRRWTANLAKIRRFRRIARRELEKRTVH
jgi:hypothetical protein